MGAGASPVGEAGAPEDRQRDQAHPRGWLLGPELRDQRDAPAERRSVMDVAARVCRERHAPLLAGAHTPDDLRALGGRLSTLSAALFAEPNPTVIKAVLHAQGRIPTPAVRLPLLPSQPGAADTALRHLGALDAAAAGRG